jgi:hypothetical protein
MEGTPEEVPVSPAPSSIYPEVFSPSPMSPAPVFSPETSMSLPMSPSSSTSSPGPRKFAQTPSAGATKGHLSSSTSKTIKSFSFENGGSEGMVKEELKQVEAIVYERYIRDLKGTFTTTC